MADGRDERTGGAAEDEQTRAAAGVGASGRDGAPPDTPTRAPEDQAAASGGAPAGGEGPAEAGSEGETRAEAGTSAPAREDGHRDAETRASEGRAVASGGAPAGGEGPAAAGPRDDIRGAGITAPGPDGDRQDAQAAASGGAPGAGLEDETRAEAGLSAPGSEGDRQDAPAQPSRTGAAETRAPVWDDNHRDSTAQPGVAAGVPPDGQGEPASGADLSGPVSPAPAAPTNGYGADLARDGLAAPQPAADGAPAGEFAPPAEAAAAGPAAGSAEPEQPPAIHPAEVLPPEGHGTAGGPPGGGEPPGGGGGSPGKRPPEPGDKPMSVVEHLDELRRRLMWMIGSLLVGVAVGFYFVKPMIDYLELPLHGLKLYITAPLDPLFAFVKISVAFGLVVASPVILYQLISYVLPALTRLERRLMFSYLPAATGLFIAGLAFGFYVFIPLVIDAMLRFAGTTLTPILTIDNYISFLLSFTLPFGVVFELPVIVVTLVRLGILSPQTLAAGRRWALMVTVVVAAIFAPPDPITPLVMALPIYGLYEVSIWVARLAARKRSTE